MQHYLLGQIITAEYEQNFLWKGKEANTKAMLFECRLYNEDNSHLQLLIFGPHRYIGVWVRVVERPKLWESLIIDPTSWHLMSYHDSCWKTDGIERLLFLLRDKLNLIHTLSVNCGWYSQINLTPEQITNLMSYVKYRDDHNGCKPAMPRPLANILEEE